MKIKTDPTIRSLHGKFPKSSLIMQSLHGKRCTHAKSFAVPNTAKVRSRQSVFSNESRAIYQVLISSSPEFLADLQLYTSIFNSIHVPDTKLPIPYQNIFSMLCYSAQKITNFDLTTLNIDNFEDLIDCIPTIKCCISSGYLRPIGEGFYTNSNFMHDILTGSVVYCESPNLQNSSEFLSFYELEFTPDQCNGSIFQSFYEILNAMAETTANTQFRSFYEILEN
jgi:hypothetical protein